MERRWLTVDDIVNDLDVSRNTVRRWLREGKLKGTPFGGKVGWRIDRHDYEAFLENQAKKVAA